MKEIEIASNSGILSGTLFESHSTEIILIIASATGVRQEFYAKFAQSMLDSGITVITFDYRGIGRSLTSPIKEVKNNAADWGRNDLESVLQYAERNYPQSKKVVLGHSIGGQLIGLAESSQKLDQIILVAAQSGYWRCWKGIGRLKMWFNWYILFPILINTFGYLNSKRLSGMENLPKHVANQWRNWGKHEDYILSDKSIAQMYYDEIRVDITAFSIEDDDFAPKKAVDWMTSQYRNSNVKSTHFNPSNFGVKKIGHFGVFKDKFKTTIWEILQNEIK